MLDELYMQDLADAMKMPAEPLPAGKVTVSAPDPEMAGMDKAFVGTRLNVPKPGQPTPQDREKMAIGLLDTLAGALRGAAAQVGGLPGDIRSILDIINQEGAEKYLGQRSFATTEEILKDTSVRVPGTKIDVPFPPVLKEGVPNRAERQGAVDVAQEVGTFLPAPGAPEAAIQGVKAVGRAIKATKNMPVGMSTQAVGQGMDELGFYSAAKQAVDAIQQPKGTGAQFLAQISKTPGVKPDEIKWTGLDEFLQSKKSVTKAEVQEYLDKNRVQIKEVKLGEPDESEIQALLNDEMGQGMTRQDAIDYLANDEGSLAPKFSKYTLPGGENYREILLTLPTNMSAYNKFSDELIAKYGQGGFDNLPLTDVERARLNKFYANEDTPQFKSGHFDQPNILAHIRVNDRVIDGKKTLFVEEVQSDWHQAGRKKGYATPDMVEANKQSVISAKNEFRNYEKTLAEKYGLPPKMTATASIKDRMNWQGNLLTTISDEEKAIRSGLEDKIKSAEQTWAASTKGVPDAPFKTTWSDLSMKRVIQMASEGGYDRIAFTTGKTQAERFDLSKQIEFVRYRKTDNGNFNLTVRTPEQDVLMEDKLFTPESLEDTFGKELSEKIIKGEGKANGFGSNLLTGLDLSVGGEGMKGFYDDILPKFLNKYAKKWDAKTGVTEIEVGKGKPTSYADFDEYQKAPALLKVPVNYIDVTPKMRESVVTKGQPMFAIGAGGAGAAATQEENK
jgi:hypothetical protein